MLDAITVVTAILVPVSVVDIWIVLMTMFHRPMLVGVTLIQVKFDLVKVARDPRKVKHFRYIRRSAHWGDRRPGPGLIIVTEGLLPVADIEP